jgi:hypothetical protein
MDGDPAVKRSHHRLPDDQPRKVIPYATEDERLKARRKASREAKQRAKDRRKNDHAAHMAATEAWVEQLINSGTGPAYRRAMMLDILKRNQPCPNP